MSKYPSACRVRLEYIQQLCLNLKQVKKKRKRKKERLISSSIQYWTRERVNLTTYTTRSISFIFPVCIKMNVRLPKLEGLVHSLHEDIAAISTPNIHQRTVIRFPNSNGLRHCTFDKNTLKRSIIIGAIFPSMSWEKCTMFTHTAP